jgi:hypothetical protein
MLSGKRIRFIVKCAWVTAGDNYERYSHPFRDFVERNRWAYTSKVVLIEDVEKGLGFRV